MAKAKKSNERPGGQRPQDKYPHPRDGNQLVHGGRQKSGEADIPAGEDQGEGMPAVGGQR